MAQPCPKSDLPPASFIDVGRSLQHSHKRSKSALNFAPEWGSCFHKGLAIRWHQFQDPSSARKDDLLPCFALLHPLNGAGGCFANNIRIFPGHTFNSMLASVSRKKPTCSARPLRVNPHPTQVPSAPSHRSPPAAQRPWRHPEGSATRRPGYGSQRVLRPSCFPLSPSPDLKSKALQRS